MKINDYRIYNFDIHDSEGGGHCAFCKTLVGGGTQDGEGKSITFMCKWFVLDYAEFAFKDLELTPPAAKIKEGETPIDIGLCNALKIVWRNLMVQKGVKPSEMARMLKVSPNSLHRYMEFEKNTGIEIIDRAFSLLGRPLELSVKD